MRSNTRTRTTKRLSMQRPGSRGSLRPELEKSTNSLGSLARIRERSDLHHHPLPGRDPLEPEGGEQAQRRRLGLFCFEIDARCAVLLQPVYAREQQRVSEPLPLVGWARPNHSDFPDGIVPSA